MIIHQMVRLLVATLFATAAVNPAQAHNVWCHCTFVDERDTLAFFHLAGDVYTAHSNAVRLWHESNVPLETGVLAEFERKLDPTRQLQPQLFRENLQGLQKLDTQLAQLDERLGKVMDYLKSKKATPGFNETLAKVLASTNDIKRLDAVGARYAEVGGKPKRAADSKKMDSVLAIFQAQQEDLKMLREKLQEVIAGARDAIPLAERGEFAQVMLSGRNAFGDKMPQFTDWFSAYDRFYVQTCMATIAVTMQVYPKGFEWLKK